ncbi:MAG: hypothetical protein ACD_25C00063G0001 [uncultured bacterium]|nr:MAG: hypothetical protein ACD_25C00063G0001 [uncultured bacterium]
MSVGTPTEAGREMLTKRKPAPPGSIKPGIQKVTVAAIPAGTTTRGSQKKKWLTSSMPT